MASALTKRALQTVGSSGFAKAKKLAALAIKVNTDSSGSPTTRGYQEAIAILQPFITSGKEIEAIDAQSLIAGYNNNLDKLSSNERSQDETVAAFKLQEQDAYFTSFDGDVGGFRNPAALVDATSESLDNLMLGVLNAVDEKEANGDSTDSLYKYLGELQKRSDTMRDLRNRYDSGELGEGQTLEGFGYYVDTNPIDGSVRRAAFLPAGLAPEGLTDGFRRLEATAKVGSALVPVYAPAQKNAQGDYIARVGDATWTGTGDAALRSDKAVNNQSLFKEGEFNIEDSAAYPVRKADVPKGNFGTGLVGRSENGEPITAMFYRGMDNKLYTVDNDTLARFKQDPILAKKLEGYIPRFSPSETREIGKEAVPLPVEVLGKEGRFASIQQEQDYAAGRADYYDKMGFFRKLQTGYSLLLTGHEPGEAPAAPEAAPAQPQATFFSQATNQPNKPETAPASTGGQLSVPDVLEKGKSFFRNATSFFRK